MQDRSVKVLMGGAELLFGVTAGAVAFGLSRLAAVTEASMAPGPARTITIGAEEGGVIVFALATVGMCAKGVFDLASGCLGPERMESIGNCCASFFHRRDEEDLAARQLAPTIGFTYGTMQV